MTNENTKHEYPENEQPANKPAAQVELTDEELEQINGGFRPMPPCGDPPARVFPPGPGIIGVL